MSELLKHRLELEDEENPGHRITVSYILDDGWAEGEELKEIIEVIDFRVRKTYTESLRDIMNAHNAHKGKWLTKDVAIHYRTMAWLPRTIHGQQYVGEMRPLAKELCDSYGVTELEAIDILNGYNVDFYLNKYYRIKHCIPLGVNPQRAVQRIAFETAMEFNDSINNGSSLRQLAYFMRRRNHNNVFKAI